MKGHIALSVGNISWQGYTLEMYHGKDTSFKIYHKVAWGCIMAGIYVGIYRSKYACLGVSWQGYMLEMYHCKYAWLVVSLQEYLLGVYNDKNTCWGCIMIRIPVWDVSWQGYLFRMYHGKDTCLGCIMTRIPVWDVS